MEYDASFKNNPNNSNKNVWITNNDKDSQDEILDKIQKLSQESNEYPEVEIENEFIDKTYEQTKNIKGPQSKTFAKHIEYSNKRIGKASKTRLDFNPNKIRNKNIKQKRFKSPTANIPRLVNYPNVNNGFGNGKTETDKRNRRRSGKISIGPKYQNNEDDDKEMLKKEYLRLKQQLMQLQK